MSRHQNGLWEIARAGYRVRGSDEHWLGELAATAAPLLAGRHQVLGFNSVLWRHSGPGLRMAAVHVQGRAPGKALLRVFGRVAGGRIRVMAAQTEGEVGSTSATFPGVVDRFRRLWPGAAPDQVAAAAVDRVDHILSLAISVDDHVTVSARVKASWERVKPHVAGGLRLRRLLTQASPLDDPSAEAVFDAKGNCQASHGAARSRDALTRLRDAATRRLGADPSTEPLGPALVDGRWSLVETFDVDRKRFIVCHRNPPGVVDPRQLTEREREIAALAALGNTNKEIAYDVGVQTSTVSSHLARVLEKLGVKSRAQLPLFWRTIHGRAIPLSSLDDALVVLRVPGDAPFAGDNARLSRVECIVARLAIEGRSNREIATVRGVSQRTVANQLASVFRKLGVFSRAELAARVFDSAN